MIRFRIRSVVAALVLPAIVLDAAPSLAQSKFIKEANTKFTLGSGAENDTALLTALNLCDVPLHVKITMTEGAGGADLATMWEGDVPAGQTAHLDTVLGPVSGALAHRVVGRVEATLPSTATDIPACMTGRNSAVHLQLEIAKPSGMALLLPAVQKVRAR